MLAIESGSVPTHLTTFRWSHAASLCQYQSAIPSSRLDCCNCSCANVPASHLQTMGLLTYVVFAWRGGGVACNASQPELMPQVFPWESQLKRHCNYNYYLF